MARAIGLRRRARPTLSRSAWLVLFAGALVVGLLIGAAIQWTLASFTAQKPLPNELGSALIFRGERVTPPFSVSDHSSGSAVDGSSPLAYAGDGRYLVSRALPSAFAADRYLEFDLNGPLPGGLAITGGQLNLRFASDTAGATACYWVELRRASSSAVLSTHGSSGSPQACVTGTTFATGTISLGAIDVSGTANDLRVRVYARDSAAGAARLDVLTVSGSTPHASFTLYPLLSRDVNAADVQLIPWGLSVP